MNDIHWIVPEGDFDDRGKVNVKCDIGVFLRWANTNTEDIRGLCPKCDMSHKYEIYPGTCVHDMVEFLGIKDEDNG